MKRKSRGTRSSEGNFKSRTALAHIPMVMEAHYYSDDDSSLDNYELLPAPMAQTGKKLKQYAS